MYQYVHPSASAERPSAISVDSFGNTYITVVLSSDDTTGGHITGFSIIKLDSNGLQRWIYFNDSMGRLSYGYDIAYYSLNIYICGYIQSFSPNELRLINACIDTLGNRKWIFKDIQ